MRIHQGYKKYQSGGLQHSGQSNSYIKYSPIKGKITTDLDTLVQLLAFSHVLGSSPPHCNHAKRKHILFLHDPGFFIQQPLITFGKLTIIILLQRYTSEFWIANKKNLWYLKTK